MLVYSTMMERCGENHPRRHLMTMMEPTLAMLSPLISILVESAADWSGLPTGSPTRGAIVSKNDASSPSPLALDILILVRQLDVSRPSKWMLRRCPMSEEHCPTVPSRSHPAAARGRTRSRW